MGKLTGESFKICYILEVKWFTSLLQCASIKYFFNINLFEPTTNKTSSKVIMNFFIFFIYVKVTSR